LLVLTNNSMYTPRELQGRLARAGLSLNVEHLWTSALATAKFVATQRPRGSAFVIGEQSMREALSDVRYTIRSVSPDYVILGETQNYSFDEITTAIRLVESGAHFIATNPEPTGPSVLGSLPACGAVAALIERATGVAPYFVGKPNPLMMREGLDTLDCHASSTIMVGDRMDTDIHAGVEAGFETILVLSGVSTALDAEAYPFRPTRVVGSVADLLDEL
jgi:NagD protein